MNTVICSKCEHTVNVDDCWCVIDTKTKARSYECKNVCLQQVAESKIDIEIPSTMTASTEVVEDWVSAYPTEGIFQRLSNWFYRSTSGYQRVKVE